MPRARKIGTAAGSLRLGPNFSTWVNQHHTGELDSSRSTSLIF
jgi:hypothetical protein